MELSFDESKRLKTLKERGLDFADANEVFASFEYTWIDDRKEYGEIRYLTFGLLDGRLVVLAWTVRNGNRRIISMRKANDREQIRYQRAMGRS